MTVVSPWWCKQNRQWHLHGDVNRRQWYRHGDVYETNIGISMALNHDQQTHRSRWLPLLVGGGWRANLYRRLLVQWHYRSLLRHINTIQELSDILIFDCGGLLDESGWNREYTRRPVSNRPSTHRGHRVKGLGRSNIWGGKGNWGVVGMRIWGGWWGWGYETQEGSMYV